MQNKRRSRTPPCISPVHRLRSGTEKRLAKSIKKAVVLTPQLRLVRKKRVLPRVFNYGKLYLRVCQLFWLAQFVFLYKAGSSSTKGNASIFKCNLLRSEAYRLIVTYRGL